MANTSERSAILFWVSSLGNKEKFLQQKNYKKGYFCIQSWLPRFFFQGCRVRNHQSWPSLNPFTTNTQALISVSLRPIRTSLFPPKSQGFNNWSQLFRNKQTRFLKIFLLFQLLPVEPRHDKVRLNQKRRFQCDAILPPPVFTHMFLFLFSCKILKTKTSRSLCPY